MLSKSNPLANWLWRELYVWPQGKLVPSAYLGALLRIAIVYVVFAQVLAVFGPSLFILSDSAMPEDLFQSILWGQLGALVLIAFPAWSVFQRRVNDMRPDIREKLSAWQFAFPLILVGLIGVMLIHALGYQTPFDRFDLSRARFWFAVMLFGSAFVPGGVVAPAAKSASTSVSSADTVLTAARRAGLEAAAARSAPQPSLRHVSAPREERMKSAPLTNVPVAVERTSKLPEQGRVKPGWFS